MYGVMNNFPVDWDQYKTYRKFYKAILRITLLVVHDYTIYVMMYYFLFVVKIPLRFRRLRNFILAIPLEQDQIPDFRQYDILTLQPQVKSLLHTY